MDGVGWQLLLAQLLASLGQPGQSLFVCLSTLALLPTMLSPRELQGR